MSTTELVRRKRNVRRNQDLIDKLLYSLHIGTPYNSEIRHEKLFRKESFWDDDGRQKERRKRKRRKEEEVKL
jgi:hypothetical protein